MKNVFYKVMCQKCKNEQIIFSKPVQKIKCLVCGTEFAINRGGKAKLKNIKIISVLE
ncbi:MAG: 30S ribosomal protein S27e [Candidatus Aenigmarchaeota archaeon ex4484_52]|nr:MAG: 30S ribosomal protein S27e [Candidatus Aenigmarchaeota archaeon ex4484_52]